MTMKSNHLIALLFLKGTYLINDYVNKIFLYVT